jgi:HEAT repeat protein
LVQILREEKSSEMKESIIEALGETGSDEAVPVLLETAQKDPDVRVRTEAVSALGRIKTAKAREALMQILKKKDGADAA